MISTDLQKAIDNLQIEDVYLRDFVARCIGDYDPKYDSNSESLALQTKHFVKQSVVVELDNKLQLLRVFVELGARWVDENAQGENDSVKVTIEAEFIAEYILKGTLEKACIDEFSLRNASYHIWPYWRELLTNQCLRMHMPRAVLPTMQLAHNRHNDQGIPDDVTDADVQA